MIDFTPEQVFILILSAAAVMIGAFSLGVMITLALLTRLINDRLPPRK